MQIAKQMAGFTPAEAETLRKAIGKKIHSLMASLKDQFLEGCAQNGVTPSVAQQLWKDMEQSQDYSFNKAHSACYALIAYRTAWLRANHPCEYMAALISSVMNTKDRVPFYVNACDEIGIEVLPPDVNSSQHRLRRRRGEDPLRPERGQERRRRRRAGDRARARGGRPVHARSGTSPSASTRRSLNKRALESLVKCGGARLDRRLAQGDARRRSSTALASGQRAPPGPARGPGLDLRPRRRERRATAEHHPPIPSGEYEKNELLALEKETLGLYVSEHPLHARPRPAAAQDRLLARRARAPPRRRDRHGRRHRLGGEAADDEEGRPDGLPAARRRHRLGRGGRVRLGLRAARELLRGRPDPRRQGPRRPQAGGRDEADRDRGLRRSRRSPSGARCGSRSTRRRRAPAVIARARTSCCATSPARRPCWSTSRCRTGLRTLQFGPGYRVQPEPDFFAEVKALLGEAAVR